MTKEADLFFRLEADLFTRRNIFASVFDKSQPFMAMTKGPEYNQIN